MSDLVRFAQLCSETRDTLLSAVHPESHATSALSHTESHFLCPQKQGSLVPMELHREPLAYQSQPDGLQVREKLANSGPRRVLENGRQVLAASFPSSHLPKSDQVKKKGDFLA